MAVQGHKDLEVWQKARRLVAAIYIVTRNFPKEETYSLTSQIRRAAISIPSNIAEGRARHSTRDFMRFLMIARGSLAELETPLLISQDLSYLDDMTLQPLLNDVNEIGRMLTGLHIKLGQKLPLAS